jgi:hypothetical protein
LPSWSVCRAGALGALLLACSLRVGPPAPSGSNTDATSTGGGSSPDAGAPAVDAGAPAVDAGSASTVSAPSCTLVAPEAKIPAGGGTSDFAWVWDTDHYLVAYSDPSVGGGDIFTLRVAADGTPLAAPVAVDPSPGASSLPDLVVTAGGYLLAWEEGTAGQVVVVQALDVNGAPVGAQVTVAATNAAVARPVVSRAPNGYAMAWMDELFGTPSVAFTFLDGSLAVSPPTKLADNAAYPSLAGDAGRVSVLWSGKDRPKGSYAIHSADLAGSPLAASNDLLVRSDPPNDLLLGRRIVTSYGYLSAWEDVANNDNQIEMALTDPAGNLIAQGEVEQPGTGDANWPHMADNGSYAGVVYYQWRNSNPQIFITFVDPSGKRVFPADMQVSSTPGGSWARFPDVAWDGAHFGVAWVDTRGGSPQLYFARVVCPAP